MFFLLDGRKDISHVIVTLVFGTAMILKFALASPSVPKLILISMDGFQFDFLDLIPPNEVENFEYMIRNGVKAKSIMNVFPTNTYPNHYTLITGMYPESHGITDNKFYDAVWKEYFDYDSRRDNVDPFWYDVGAEPIYVTNKKAGPSRNSGSVVWPAGIGKVKGIGPDRFIPFADSWTRIDNIERVDTLISWFTDENDPINLGLLYFLEPDEMAHGYGGGSKNVTDLIKGELNNVLGHPFTRLKENGLFEEMNIILTSDHGFANYTKEKAVILSDYLNSSWYKVGSVDYGSYGTTKHIFPEEGPAFKKGYVSEQFNSVDIYPLMCHILGIEPAPNNGSIDSVKNLLRERSDINNKDNSSTTVTLLTTFAGLCALLAGIYIVCICQKARNQRRNMLHSNVKEPGDASLGSAITATEEL